jgi:hypothetical protein
VEYPGGGAALDIIWIIDCDDGCTESALSVYSGLGGATDLGLKKPSASLAAIASASAAEISGWAKRLPADVICRGNLSCIVGAETLVPGVCILSEKSRA